MGIVIRNETIHDERIVEEITKRAFWNLHAMGCDEHYLVHQMRKHKDFIKDLDLVLELDGKVIGNIMYTKSILLSESGKKIDTYTFGPVSIDIGYQRKGYGSKLIIESICRAKEKGICAIVIFGHPGNYVTFGFVGSRKYKITDVEGRYPCGLLVLPLVEENIGKEKAKFIESEVYSVDSSKLEEFDKTFERIEKYKKPSQEEFDLLSNAYLDN
jgi:putative acetyltransferase